MAATLQATSKRPKRPTLTSLRAFAREWQGLLNLSHWTLELVWATKADTANGLFAEDLDASVRWQVEHSHAIILLSKACENPWETIVHELLHLANEGHRDKPFKYESGYERSINHLAKLLYTLSQRLIPSE